MTSAERSPGLPTLLAYSGPAVPLAMVLLPLMAYLPPFYAREVGLGLSGIGVVFLVARTWDAISDPVLGALSDRTRHRWGRRKPWIAAGAPLLMVSLYFLCVPPGEVGLGYLFVWILLTYLAWTMVQIPYLSWGAELSRDYAARTRITGFREVGSIIGILAASTLPLAFLGAGTDDLGAVLRVLALALVALIPVTVIVALAVAPSASLEGAPPRGWVRLVRAAGSNTPLMRVLGSVLVYRTAWSMFDAAFVFFVGDFLGFPLSFLILIVVQYVSSIAAAPLVVRLANRFGKHVVLAGALAGGAVFLLYAAFFMPRGELWPILLVWPVLGVLNAPLWLLPTAIVADTIDYGVFRSGDESSGLYMAGFNLAQKLALALGVGLALPLLDLSGFDPAGDNGASAAAGLQMVAAVLPAALLMIAIIPLWRFPLTRARHDLLRRWLARSARIESSV
ncbi:MFS transporter [Marinicauda salina]|uniref:MFS transporter n=1 Tax=Marinicauda salina TaxID=2135793 RepID=UPI0011B22150|nr:MFS transporter [Marinicauda salina]